jgi:hypothetical protein
LGIISGLAFLLITIVKKKKYFMRKLNLTAAALGCLLFTTVFAQDDKKIHLITGAGFNKIQGRLGKTFRSTLAFNSGFEKAFFKNWYGQLEVNFNTLKYDQQVKDNNSPYLFQNTNSSFFMISANWGRDFRFGKSLWFGSLYSGGGFLSLGKPRIIIDDINNIVTQKIVRGNGIFGKGGARIGVNTKSAIFHTLYVDGSWLTSSVQAEGTVFRNAALFIGMRVAMGKEDKLIKKQMKSVRRVSRL